MKYTREALQAAVDRSTSIAGVLRILGLKAAGGSHTFIKRRILQHGIDISHFGARHRKIGRKELADAARQSTSIAGVLKHLGIAAGGGGYSGIKRRITEFGIDVSHFTGQGHNRGKVSLRRKSAAQFLILRPQGSNRLAHSLLRRSLMEIGVAYECAVCTTSTEWNGKPITLHVDHINGDWLDCRRSNLRFLCPNCHSQTWNYAGRNGLACDTTSLIGYRRLG